MKLLFTLLSLASLASLTSLSGCAYAPSVPHHHASRHALLPADPGQWRVVSVTPVPLGTGERTATASGTGSSVQYSSEPIARTVYMPQPVYVPAPMYSAPAPYYYPPVSIGLDFMLGRSWGRHGRNFGGVGIGSRWGR